jgi:glutaconate CoA-transferase subunit B
VTLDRVQENTGFELAAKGDIPVTDAPTERELAVLRKLDPQRLYTS